MVADFTTSGLCKGVGKVPKYWEIGIGIWMSGTLEEDEAWLG